MASLFTMAQPSAEPGVELALMTLGLVLRWTLVTHHDLVTHTGRDFCPNSCTSYCSWLGQALRVASSDSAPNTCLPSPPL